MCSRFSQKAEPETTTDWKSAHGRIVALGAERAGHERQVCRWLLCAERLGVFARPVAQVQSGLEHLGFKATRARALIDAALGAGASLDPALLMRAALRATP